MGDEKPKAKRLKIPRRNLQPRAKTQSAVNMKHHMFALEYVKDFDAGAAYLRAGYSAKNEIVAGTAGRALLRNPMVWAVVEEHRVRMAERTGMNGESVIRKFHVLYQLAIEKGDLMTAGTALKELGKIYGVYEKHNAQKRYSQADLERMKQRLAEAGMDFTRVNYPSAN